MWLAALKLVLAVVPFLIDKARQRDALSDAQAKILARQANDSLNYLDRIREARKQAESAFDSADGVPDETDPNLRD